MPQDWRLFCGAIGADNGYKCPEEGDIKSPHPLAEGVRLRSTPGALDFLAPEECVYLQSHQLGANRILRRQTI